MKTPITFSISMIFRFFLIILLTFSLYQCGEKIEPAIDGDYSTGKVNNDCSLLDELSGYAAHVNVTGGETYTNYVVTNANDAGTGSYRAALSQGNRYITFDPSLSYQSIYLQSEILVYGDNITLDGRAAPGLTIRKYATKFEGDNYVVAYLQYHQMDGTDDEDGITFRNAPTGGQHFFVYKCSFNYATDGAIDVIWNRGNDVYGTVSYCKFQYIDKTILHHAGDAIDEGGRYHLSFDHNWFYRTGQRNPTGRDGDVHYYNNLLEGWGGLNNDGQGVYPGPNSSYLIENNIAIAASVGDPAWSGETIIVPKKKAFAVAWEETTAGIRMEGNRLENGAYEDTAYLTMFNPPYAYAHKLESAAVNSGLESYIRDNANAVNFDPNCPDTGGDSDPVVTITYPYEGYFYSRSKKGIRIRSTASDPEGISQMRIYLNGELHETCNDATNCSYRWRNKNASLGTYVIRVEADDVDGNTGADEVAFHLQN